jgi:hypothetical protein
MRQAGPPRGPLTLPMGVRDENGFFFFCFFFFDGEGGFLIWGGYGRKALIVELAGFIEAFEINCNAMCKVP